MKKFLANLCGILLGILVFLFNGFCIYHATKFISSNHLFLSSLFISISLFVLVMIGIGSIKSDEAHNENVRRNLEDN